MKRTWSLMNYDVQFRKEFACLETPDAATGSSHSEYSWYINSYLKRFGLGLNYFWQRISVLLEKSGILRSDWRNAGSSQVRSERLFWTWPAERGLSELPHKCIILKVFYNICCFFWKGVNNDHTDYNEFILKKIKNCLFQGLWANDFHVFKSKQNAANYEYKSHAKTSIK